MINGAHVLIYSNDADADRVFLRDVLHFANVDAGGGWLIFKLPASEAAIHPGKGAAGMLESVLYLMCDDIESEIARLEAEKVSCAAVTEERWGRVTSLLLPSGGRMGLYQPLHPTALALEPLH